MWWLDWNLMIGLNREFTKLNRLLGNLICVYKLNRNCAEAISNYLTTNFKFNAKYLI